MKRLTSAEIRSSILTHSEEWERILADLFSTAEDRTFDFLGAPALTEDEQVVFEHSVHFCLWRWHMLGMVAEAAIHHYLDVAFQEDTPIDEERFGAEKGPFAKEPFRIKANAQCPFHGDGVPVA